MLRSGPTLLALLVLASCDWPADPGPVLRVELTLSRDSLLVGDTAVAEARITRDDIPEFDAEVDWWSSDPDVATVEDGVVTARAAGLANISAGTGGFSDSVLVWVFTPETDCSASGDRGRAVSEHDDVLRAIDSPHRVASTLTVDSAGPLIEPGALLCFDPGVRLLIGGGLPGQPSIGGTEPLPIILSSIGTNRSWAGVRVVNLSRPLLRHILIERADTGVWVESYSGVEIQRATIRDGGVGVFVSRTASANLRDVRLLHNDGNALDASGYEGRHRSTFRFEGSLRISGNGGYPARLRSDNAVQLLSEETRRDSIFGNGRDTLLIWVENPTARAVISPELPWWIFHVEYGSPYLTADVLPGGSLRSTDSTLTGTPGSLRFRGTPEAPVRISGTIGVRGGSWVPQDPPHDTTRWSHVIFQDAVLNVDLVDYPLLMEDAQFMDSEVVISAPGSVLDRITVTGAPNTGLHLKSGQITLRNCSVSGSGGAGIEVMDALGSMVRHCAIFENSGMGVTNSGEAVLDARENWWGDPAGPNGPAGDGVAGAVDASDPLPAPPEGAGGN